MYPFFSEDMKEESREAPFLIFESLSFSLPTMETLKSEIFERFIIIFYVSCRCLLDMIPEYDVLP